MTGSKWAYVDVIDFWTEDPVPTGKGWHYVYDSRDINDYDWEALSKFLPFLSKLNVIEFGCVYETIDMIRIRR